MGTPSSRRGTRHARIPTVERARLDRDKRLSTAEIATRFGVTRHAVRSRLRADGIRRGDKAPRGRRGQDARTQSGTPGHPVIPARGRPPGRGKLQSQVSMDELVRLYHQDGLSLGDIAQQFGVTRQGVHNLLKAHGIATRDGSQARRLALAQGKVAGKSLRRQVVGFAKVPPTLGRTSGVLTVALKRTSLQFDPQDMTVLARMARQETAATGIRVTAAGIVRRLIKAYLRAQAEKR